MRRKHSQNTSNWVDPERRDDSPGHANLDNAGLPIALTQLNPLRWLCRADS